MLQLAEEEQEQEEGNGNHAEDGKSPAAGGAGAGAGAFPGEHLELEVQVQSQFQLLWAVFQSHSTAEDEVIWPALKEKARSSGGKVRGLRGCAHLVRRLGFAWLGFDFWRHLRTPSVVSFFCKGRCGGWLCWRCPVSCCLGVFCGGAGGLYYVVEALLRLFDRRSRRVPVMHRKEDARV